MNIHEYQAKELFQAFGIPVPKGGLAQTQAQAVEVARSLDGPVWVVKAQVHAGGRGKAGGVRVCKSIEEVEEAAGAIIGMTLVTKQTGAQGKKVHKVWVEQGTNFTAELYLAVVLDRGQGLLTIMASPSGGMDIEAVAEATPEKIFTTRLDGNHHLWAFQARQLFFGCGLNPKQVGQGVKIVQALVRLAVEKDATQVEVNPLAITADGDLIALDAKVSFDESGLARHPDVVGLVYDPTVGPGYAFILNLVCTGLVTFFFIPELTGFKYRFDTELMKRMLGYSWPILLLGIAGILNQTADKIIFPLVYKGPEAQSELAVYGACVKIAMIMAMITQAFRYAYEPFVFGKAKDRNSGETYATAMKFFIIFTLLAFLCVVGYMDILKHIIAPDYWPGLRVVPIVMAA